MIYVTGSLAYDYIMDFPGKIADQIIPEKIHQISISFLVSSLREGFGGTAGNIAYSLSLFKNPVSVIACSGRDFSPYKRFLKNHYVNCQYIKTIKSDYTARAYITTDTVNNQITGFYPGALNFDKTLHLPKESSGSDFVVVAPTDPMAMDNYINEAVVKKIPFLFDPGMQLPRLAKNTLIRGVNNAKIIIGNDYETSLLAKKLGVTALKLKKNQIMVTTLGEKGCLIKTENKLLNIKAAKPVKVVDPTGAGDAFRAGFITAYIRGFDLATCGRMGNLTAVYTVEKYGTSTHKFTIKDFKKRYKENYKYELRY